MDNPLTEITIEIAVIKLVEPQIIEAKVNDFATVEGRHMYDIKKANMSLAGGLPYCVLIDLGDSSVITDEARAITASKEYQQDTIANAIIIHSFAQKMVARFYLKFNKPHIKSNYFLASEKEKAFNWLREQLNQNS